MPKLKLVMAFFLLAYSLTASAAKYEYKVFIVHYGDSISSLARTCPKSVVNRTCWHTASTESANQLASDGWEIISVDGQGDKAYVWARRVTSNEQ